MAYASEKYQSMFQGKSAYLGPDVESKHIPTPTGGWDAISPLSAMEPQYAVILDNWIPRPGYVELRGGYNNWCQSLTTSPVNSLMCYRPTSGTEKLFAASSSTLWDVSTYGVPTQVLSGKLGDKWQHVNFTPANSFNYLLMVNGIDNYTAYNGTVWSTPTITGVTSSTLIHINVHKRRVWFIQSNSTSAWYLATDAIAGAATQFDLGAFMNKGGYLVAMATWTVDGGNGPDDMAVFISSKGQCIIYKGTDPNNANAWALVGVFDLARPLGRRCFVKLGSDVGLITLSGLIPLSQALPFDPASDRSVAITNRIQNATLQSAQLAANNFGWQAIEFPQQTLLVLNIPQLQASTQIQYVQNTITNAWASISGWNANVFELYNDSLYFGDNFGNVCLAYSGASDLSNTITADMKCAFNYFEVPGRIKNMSMLRPLLVSDGLITPTLAVDVDYANSSPAAPVSVITPSGAVWDGLTSTWDQVNWSTGSTTVNNWLSVTALGNALAVRMKVNVAGGSNSSSNTLLTSVFDTGTFDTAVFDGNGQTTASGTGLLTLQVNSFESLMQMGGPI